MTLNKCSSLKKWMQQVVMVKKIISFLFLFGLFIIDANAQFITTGDASETTCNCFEVTDDVSSETGSFYKTANISLNTAFHYKFSVNFGCENTGGEGLAFVMQSGGWTTGSGTYNLGYDGIAGNSLSVEFDTRDNDASGEITNWDIASDHISLQDNGDSDHEDTNPNNLLGIPSGLNIGEVATPHAIKPGFPNVEDCTDHLVEITWTPGANQTIEIKVDGVVSLTYIGNMIADQFGGNPNVKWGWTGTTSTFTNTQTVCMALLPEFTYTPTNCPGEEIDFTDASCSFFSIASWDWDFDGLGTSTLTDPSFTFAAAGSYAVDLKITDSEGCEKTVTVDIPIGFDTETSVDDATVCIGTTTIIHAEGIPFEETECCFRLVLNDLWGDYWGSGVANELEIIADGISFGFYTPTSYDPGTPTSDTIDICFEQGTELEFIIHGEDSPAECAYFFYDEDLTEILSVDGSGGAWVDGATETYTVDCGLVPPEYEYLWDNAVLLSDETDPDPTATIPTDTWFHVSITDPATGCTIIDSIEVTINPPVNAVISGIDTICDGGTGELIITFTGPGPYEIDIDGPAGALPTITGIVSSPYTLVVDLDGDYTITAVSGDGCVGTFSGIGTLEVIIPFAIEIAESATYCEGDIIADLTVTSTGGGNVNWYDDASLITSIGTGSTYSPPSVIGTTTYYATETENIFGCEGSATSVTITINPIPPAPVYTGVTELCEGIDPADLIGEPSLGGTITWYDDPPPGGTILATGVSFPPVFDVPGATIYITETADGCESLPTEIIITVNPTPDPPAVSGDTEYCEGDTPSSLTATVASGGSIEWRNSGGTLLGSGINYTPTLTVGETIIFVYEVLGACISEPTEVTIIVQAAPTVNVPEQVYICYGDSIQITAENNGYAITWSDGQEGETVWLKPEITSTYIVTATNPACGSSTDEVLITVYDLPDIMTSNDTVIGSGGDVEMWAFSSDSENVFIWSPEVLQCYTANCSEVLAIPNQATVYVITVTDDNNCSNSDSILVDINGIMEVFVPNVFSPNGDGSNDFLIVYGPRLFNFSIEIYDRWGKLIFKTDNQKENWDGTFKDRELAPQTFVYILKGENVLGEKIVKEGNITIIK